VRMKWVNLLLSHHRFDNEVLLRQPSDRSPVIDYLVIESTNTNGLVPGMSYSDFEVRNCVLESLGFKGELLLTLPRIFHYCREVTEQTSQVRGPKF
jgi:hypothetical protein